MGLLDFWKKAAAPVDPGELQRQLDEAVAKRDYDLVKKALNKGADPNTRNGKALKDAFASQYWSIVTLLLDKGADARNLDFDPMDAAIRSGQESLAKQLYKQGFKPDTTDTENNAVLITATRNDYDTFKWLKTLPGVDISVGNEKPLQRAFEKNNWYFTGLLLDAGADPKALPFDPMDAAIRAGQENLAKRLYKLGFKPDTTDSENNAVLISATRNDYDTFNWLKTLPEVDVRFGNEKPLQRAFKKNNWYFVRLLLDEGADPKALPFDPMDAVIRAGQENLAKRLYKLGFKPDTTDSESNAVLIAATRNDYDTFNWLKALPEVDVSFGGEKPLQRAFEKSNWYFVRLLLDEGADPKSLPFDPMDAAVRGGQENLAKRLYKEGFKPKTTNDDQNALITAVERNDYDMLKKLMDMPEMDIHFNNEMPLQRAMKKKNWYIAGILLDAGADPAVLPFDPVLTAAASGQEGTMKKLQKLGMPIDTVTDGQTPLSAAAASGDLDSVNWLLKQGVDVHAAGNAALKQAAKTKRWNIAILLMSKGADGTFLLGHPDLTDDARELAEKTALEASARQTAGMHRIRQRKARQRRPSP